MTKSGDTVTIPTSPKREPAPRRRTKAPETRAAALMDHHLQSVVTRALLAPRGERDIRDVLAPYALSEGLTPS